MDLHRRAAALSLLLALAAPAPGWAQADTPLAAARRDFVTSFRDSRPKGDPLPPPPAKVARFVRYPSRVGNLAAYVTLAPADGRKRPAIVRLTGGDPNSNDDGVFKSGPADNDQTARQYREAGVITMYPTLRGGNDNPGHREGFFGEVDDVLAAADFLAKQPGVDHDRIYLGGHSTGGTLALLVAEASPRFRAVFSFGPVSDLELQQRENVPLDPANAPEMALRQPLRWLGSVQGPLFVFEGAKEPSNLDELQTLQQASSNSRIRFHSLNGATHFSTLAPTNWLIARKILADTGPSSNIGFDQRELDAPFQR